MAWTLSRFRAGDLVEVRSKEEILATLDQNGCVDAMPFMPEMLQYCGQRFRVRAVAHKTCDTIRNTGGRRLNSAVHLMGLRCDGSAHGGCQAECNLFWKDIWLKRINSDGSDIPQSTAFPITSSSGCSEGRLLAQTRAPDGADYKEPRYACQATKLFEASVWLRWWDLRQYIFDVTSRNHRIGHVLRALWLASLHRLLARTPFGYQLLESFYNGMHRVLTGHSSPWVVGTIPIGTTTPTAKLDLKPGELVRIKSKMEIEKTVDKNGKNRGLSFDKEMAPYCGSIVRVRSSVEMIIDEKTGRMRHMKQPCVMLEGVVCNAWYTECRLMCPRLIPSYWREAWLERVEEYRK